MAENSANQNIPSSLSEKRLPRCRKQDRRVKSNIFHKEFEPIDTVLSLDNKVDNFPKGSASFSVSGASWK